MRETQQLNDRLAEIGSRHPGSQPEMIADVVRAVLAHETSLLAEVETLGHTISRAKAEIAALRVDDITDHQIPFATDELDAIVDHTATATNAILSSCETLDHVAGDLTGEPADRLQDATTRIYEACSFQDITGQRITKVVAALKTIEAKVEQIIATFGGTAPISAVEPEAAAGETTLLNGPQHPAVAMDQSDIDRLLASFE